MSDDELRATLERRFNDPLRRPRSRRRRDLG